MVYCAREHRTRVVGTIRCNSCGTVPVLVRVMLPTSASDFEYATTALGWWVGEIGQGQQIQWYWLVVGEASVKDLRTSQIKHTLLLTIYFVTPSLSFGFVMTTAQELTAVIYTL